MWGGGGGGGVAGLVNFSLEGNLFADWLELCFHGARHAHVQVITADAPRTSRVGLPGGCN